jgi:hypothetical protein
MMGGAAREAVMTIRTRATVSAAVGPRAGTGGRSIRPAGATTAAREAPSVPIGERDLATLTWDLTIHERDRVLASGLGSLLGGAAGALVGAEARIAGVGLAAARHALPTIEAALLRVEAGMYGLCERCEQPPARERLRTTPTTPRRASCHAAYARP